MLRAHGQIRHCAHIHTCAKQAFGGAEILACFLFGMISEKSVESSPGSAIIYLYLYAISKAVKIPYRQLDTHNKSFYEEVEQLGAIDVEGKQYLSNPVFFADAFNYLIYDGEQVIKPEKLQELDTTELTVPYGNNARVPVQKYRDLLK